PFGAPSPRGRGEGSCRKRPSSAPSGHLLPAGGEKGIAWGYNLRLCSSPRTPMNFHEYQAKQLFADYGIAVPPGRVARTPEEAVDAAKAIGGDFWVVKAQIHAGGRGKAGGVKLSRSLDEVREYAKGMLGTKMETYQSAGVALPIDSVLVTQATDIAK